MRVASIIAENILQAQNQINQAATYADIIELRIDYLTEINIAEIDKLRQEISLPVLFTLRKQSHGGKCQLPEAKRLELIEQLAALMPEYIDIEIDVPVEFAAKLLAQYPVIKLIRSYHNFTETPADLMALFQQMQDQSFAIIKIAMFAQNIIDTLRLLIFLQQINQQHAVAGMAMGEYGQISRILAPVVGSPLLYGSVDETTAAAPGQLTLVELTNIYRVQLLNRDTKIYALLGDPVSGSIGHRFHNQAFAERNENAVYVKIKIANDDLAEAMSLLRCLPFDGFSVTMPHKESVVPLVDQLQGVAQAIDVVNTIKRVDDKYLAFNTDGLAGAQVLAERLALKDSRVLILGAGGSAKAIAYAVYAEGAKVTLCNRTLERAKIFAEKFSMDYLGFEQLFAAREITYDVIVNTLPVDAYQEQCGGLIAAKCRVQVALDIVYQSTMTPFMQLAQQAGWLSIDGVAFYRAQALAQLKIWFEHSLLP